ncbi:hypothetical protein LRN66_15610, partial [Staphylococcus aureus]|nr:hypothetical protein [Staphylococcus aureus]
DPAYDKGTARLLLDTSRREVAGGVAATYAEVFQQGTQRGMQADLLDPRLADFDLPRLAAALDGERDRQFGYLGLQT